MRPPQPLCNHQIGQILAARDQLSAAIDNYGEALQQSPESPELLTALGLLLLRAGDSQRAFDQLGASLLHEPRGARAILAAGSIIQVQRGPPRGVGGQRSIVQNWGLLAGFWRHLDWV
jgi:tetratricopeptide (TPR) repeat protein